MNPKLPEFCFTTCDCWFDSRIFEWHQNQILIAHVDPFCRTSPYRRKEVSQDSWMLLGRSCDAVKTERMWMREMKCFRTLWALKVPLRTSRLAILLAKPHAILIVVLWSRSNRLLTTSMRTDKSCWQYWNPDAPSLLPCLFVYISYHNRNTVDTCLEFPRTYPLERKQAQLWSSLGENLSKLDGFRPQTWQCFFRATSEVPILSQSQSFSAAWWLRDGWKIWWCWFFIDKDIVLHVRECFDCFSKFQTDFPKSWSDCNDSHSSLMLHQEPEDTLSTTQDTWISSVMKRCHSLIALLPSAMPGLFGRSWFDAKAALEGSDKMWKIVTDLMC